MNKNRSFIIAIALVMIIFFLIINSFFSPNEKDDSVYVLNWGNVDQSITSKNLLKSMVKRTYYENENYSGFSSASLSMNSPDIYQINWILEMMDILNYYPKEISSEVISFINSYSPDDLFEAKILASIFNKLKIKGIEQEKILINILENHYDENERLFFYNNSNDSVKEKIAATSIAIDIINNLDYRFPQMDEIKDVLIDLYKQNIYFSEVDINNDLLNNGGLIIDALLKLGIKEKSINVEEIDRNYWLKYWNENYVKSIGDDWISIEIIKKIKMVNSFFESDEYLNTVLLKKYLLKQDIIENATLDQFMLEPQYLSNILNLYNEYDIQILDIEKVRKLIDESISSDFTRNKKIKMNMQDNYYGLALAVDLSVDVNKDKAKKLLDVFHRSLIEEDSYISDDEKLKEIYYLVKSYDKLNVELKNKKKLSLALENYINTVVKEHPRNYQKLISNMTKAVGIQLIINNDVSKKSIATIDKIIKTMDTKEQQMFFNTIDSSDIYYLLHLTNLIDKYPDFIEKLKYNMNAFYKDGGYSSKEHLQTPDIVSTYKAVSLQFQIAQKSQKNQNELNSFLETLSSPYGFKLSESSSYTNLSTLYAGYQILLNIYGDK